MLALGIDAADDAITLALVESGTRAPRLVGSWREARPEGVPLADALRAAIAKRCPSPPDAAASAFPGRQATFRLLRLPFSDQARLAATVPYELESLVPFELASAIISFVALERGPSGATVFAAIAPRDALRAHLDELEAAGIDPAIVDLGGLAVAGLFERPGADVLVVEPRDDGGIALVRGGRVAGLHVVDGGAARDAASLLAHVRWSALALTGGEEDALPPLALIGPGADAARGLAADLGTAAASVPQLLPGWAAGASIAHLRAVALAARAAGALRTGVNLRAGELAYHAPSEEARRQMRSTAIVAAIAVVLAVVAFGTAIAQRRAELAGLRAQVAASARAALPNAAPGSERIQLEAAVEALARRRDTLAGGSAGRPPVLDVLRSIAETVPASTPLEVQDLTLDAEGVRFAARTDSYESVEIVKRALESVPGTREPQVKDVKTGVDGRVEFRASLEFGPREAS